MISTEETTAIIKKFGTSPKDSGSSAVQIAILTKRIENLTPHFGEHDHDHQSKRGLMQMIGKRRALLKYLANNDQNKYQFVIKELGIRK